ncbi:dihydrofolate reductase family protein [Saccharopolyspora sp. NPDC050642]|uniref:dihydrofolate reductase family protein n=1 Tax=Saccharopolyspora sp. NPDC050642 TaxID=3157099 RepID=UPI0033F8F8A2
MRKFKLQVQTTIDGYMSGPNGEMDWMTLPWSEDLASYIEALNEPIGTIVLGRKLAEGFIPHWASQPADETQEGIDRINNTPKVVISTTLTESPWENTVVASDLVETIRELKAQPGGDIIAYGGGTLVASLIAEGLLDELHLIVNPTAIGAGLPVFGATGSNQQFDFVAVRPFECGIVALQYAPKMS